MNFQSKIFLVAALVLTLFACTKDFDEINENPNAPTDVNSGLILPGVLRDVMNTVMNEAWGIGNIVVQQTAKNQFVNEDRYLWGELNGIWNSVYDNMRDVNNIIRASEERKEQNYLGVGLVLRAWLFSLATDAYGDIPYSEAIQGKSAGIYYPKYDTQETIYNGILNDLKTANEILGTSAEAISGDVLFNGDIDKWKKLSNSLRVRYLMRISKKKDVSGDLQTIVNAPATYPVFESNADNAVYNYASSNPDQFPLYSARIGSFNEFRASSTMVDFLKSVNDPRINVFFRPTPASIGSDTAIIRGIPNGLDDVTAQTYLGGQQNHSQIGSLFYEAAISGEGLKVAKGVIMTYAELQFLLAEAAEKGLIGGSAEDFYKNGVNASFNFYNLAIPADYFTSPLTAYTGTTEQKLEKTGTQKWVALYFQGMEAWFDWRRTRFPKLLPSVDNQNDDRIPVRFIYPIIEGSLNGANRQEAVARQGADDINTLMWYLK